MSQDPKVRLAFLWVLYVTGMVAHAVLWTWEPGFIQRLETGDLFHEDLPGIPSPRNGYDPGATLAVLAAITVIGPLAAAYASLLMSDRANRAMNLALGVVAMAFNVYHLSPSCAAWLHGKLIVLFHIGVTGATLVEAWRLGTKRVVGTHDPPDGDRLSHPRSNGLDNLGAGV